MTATSSAITRIRPKVEPIYFTSDDDQPSIFSLVTGLDGICEALDDLEPRVGDANDLDLIARLTTAARVLSNQLVNRWYGSEPPGGLKAQPGTEVVNG